MREQRYAFVLGATGGIGSAITHMLVAHHYHVYGTTFRDRDHATRMNETQEHCTIVSCDVTDEVSVAQVFDGIFKQNIPISVYVNAVSPPLNLKTFDQLTIDEFAAPIHTILTGSARVLTYIVPHMKAQRSGVIIHLLTALLDTPATRLSAYLAAKSGLWGLTRTLALELKPYGVRVVGLSPSFVETDLIRAFPLKLIELEKQKQPDGKFLEPSDIAALIWDIIQHHEKYPTGGNVNIRDRSELAHLLQHA